MFLCRFKDNCFYVIAKVKSKSSASVMISYISLSIVCLYIVRLASTSASDVFFTKSNVSYLFVQLHIQLPVYLSCFLSACESMLRIAVLCHVVHAICSNN